MRGNHFISVDNDAFSSKTAILFRPFFEYSRKSPPCPVWNTLLCHSLPDSHSASPPWTLFRFVSDKRCWMGRVRGGNKCRWLWTYSQQVGYLCWHSWRQQVHKTGRGEKKRCWETVAISLNTHTKWLAVSWRQKESINYSSTHPPISRIVLSTYINNSWYKEHCHFLSTGWSGPFFHWWP